MGNPSDSRIYPYVALNIFPSLMTKNILLLVFRHLFFDMRSLPFLKENNVYLKDYDYCGGPLKMKRLREGGIVVQVEVFYLL